VIVAVSVGVLLGASATGCTSGPDSRLATWPGDPNSGYARLQARNEGVLGLVNGCVVLQNGLTDDAMTLVLPAAVTTFDGTAVTIRGKSLPLGTTVWMGGGAYGDMPSNWSVPTTCPRGEDKWWATGDLEVK
jgi:hypothetical protein